MCLINLGLRFSLTLSYSQMSNAFDSFDSWVISLGCWIVKKSNYTWWWQGFLSFLLRYKWRFKEWQHVHSLGYILSASCWQIILSIYNHFSVWVWNVLIILALIEYHFSSAQSFSSVWLFATPWTTARQASLSITNSRIYPNTCPLSQWCHPTISSSVVPFSSHLKSFPASESFQMSQLFT